ncbi:MAG: class I SAM-dependent methyltransferase [Streptosporangiaceae bacterium]
MRDAGGVVGRLGPLLTRVFGEDLPLRIRGWDGSETGPPDAPGVVISHRRALRRLLWQPNELGLGRAYVAGELEVDGDFFDALRTAMRIVERAGDHGITLTRDDKRELVRTAVMLGAVGPEPKPPPEEADPSSAGDDGRRKDAPPGAPSSAHYSVGNDFYRYVLGPSMFDSSGYWTRRDDQSYVLDDAVSDMCDLVAHKLGLAPGMRLLDVGCGWGTLATHVAGRYDVRVVGVTLSQEQADDARKRVLEAGLEDRIEIRVQDYEAVADGPYDAIAALGEVEHVGAARFADYAGSLFRVLRPGGRLLSHQIARRPERPTPTRPTFVRSYVHPRGELLPVGQTIDLWERAGFEVRDVEALRDHYALTLRRWVAGLREHWEECAALTSPGRARAWLLYMTGSALAFEAGRLGANQVLAVRRHEDGRSDIPLTRTE